MGPDEQASEADLAAKGEDHRRRRHYFVDEAGDPSLFNRRKAVVVGLGGSSRYFAVGALDVPDPDALDCELTDLRRSIVADPYFAGVPSLDPARNKTAVAFHAKDDLPEIRRQVLQVLLKHPIKFYAVVRDKHVIVAEVRRRNARDQTYRYSPNDLYDQMVSQLFKDRLHKGEEFRVCFARRGSSDRTQALRSALQTARSRFARKWHITTEAPIDVIAASPRSATCLQAVDYFLWTLQRRFERHEPRFLDLLWSRVGLVISVDSGEKAYGTYYSREHPIPHPDKLKKDQRV